MRDCQVHVTRSGLCVEDRDNSDLDVIIRWVQRVRTLEVLLAIIDTSTISISIEWIGTCDVLLD